MRDGVYSSETFNAIYGEFVNEGGKGRFISLYRIFFHVYPMLYLFKC